MRGSRHMEKVQPHVTRVRHCDLQLASWVRRISGRGLNLEVSSWADTSANDPVRIRVGVARRQSVVTWKIRCGKRVLWSPIRALNLIANPALFREVASSEDRSA